MGHGVESYLGSLTPPNIDGLDGVAYGCLAFACYQDQIFDQYVPACKCVFSIDAQTRDFETSCKLYV